VLSVATITSIVIFLVVGYSCYRNGLFSTLVMLFIIVFSAMAAVALYVPLWRVPLFAKMGWHAPPILFLSTFLLCVGIMQSVANYLLPPRLTLPKRLDIIGGAVLGLVNAYLMTGVLMMAFAMFPGTGGPSDKVVVLRADAFFAKTMAMASRRSGSVTLDADAFLEAARREKYLFTSREIKDREEERLEIACGTALDRLYQPLLRFVEKEKRFPERVEELATYLPGRVKEKDLPNWLVCPCTGYRYRCAPVDMERWESIRSDRTYILLYDAVGGEAGHQGRQAGRRAVLLGNGNAEWLDEETFEVWIRAQYNRVHGDEGSR
jgi:hypothetical protein